MSNEMVSDTEHTTATFLDFLEGVLGVVVQKATFPNSWCLCSKLFGALEPIIDARALPRLDQA